MGIDWTNEEIELILADYFSMLELELTANVFNKTEHRKNLLPCLNSRSEGSIEFKHQNISAVLANLGQPFISGYKPRYNYQTALEDYVLNHLIGNKKLDNLFQYFSDKEIDPRPIDTKFDNASVDPPKLGIAKEPSAVYIPRGVKTNYLLREQSNSKLGMSGENFALKFEKWSMANSGLGKFIDKVEWVSRTVGDGLGFDILSRNRNGTDKYIEVNTTKLSKEAPFYFSRNEMDFSLENSKNFHLYRVFDFEKTPKIFALKGSLNKMCHYQTETYKGYF